jgi:hypothetical protein
MDILKDQICQAFDPMMILPEKNLKKTEYGFVMSTSCIAPAYVFLDGIHGKKFLCDFHYFYEQDIVSRKSKKEWSLVAKTCIENLDSIKDTFNKNIEERIITEKCWCEKDAFVELDPNSKFINGKTFFCNFHFRKYYYRCLTNKIPLTEEIILRDERIFMKETIKEEASLLMSTLTLL